MINWIRQQFCAHEIELVKENAYSFGTMTTYICKKCGYVIRVKTWPWWAFLGL